MAIALDLKPFLGCEKNFALDRRKKIRDPCSMKKGSVYHPTGLICCKTSGKTYCKSVLQNGVVA
jgi:hypothetical protein